jgi:hypothetical protein
LIFSLLYSEIKTLYHSSVIYVSLIFPSPIKPLLIGKKKESQASLQSLNKREMEDNTMKDINKESINHQERRFFSKWILPLLIFLLLGFSFFLYFSLQYLLGNWEELTVEEILYHIKSPMGGASESLVRIFILSVLLPALGISLFLIFLYILLQSKNFEGILSLKSKGHFLSFHLPRFFNWKKVYLGFCFFLALFFFSLTLIDAWDSISLGSYLSSQLHSSKFIEENYVDPKGIELHFPEKKRNLIYIYMESTELTFMDEAHGGAFPDNLLPEMTALSKEGEDFSGEGDSRNGGISLPGATWTMGAIFAQSTGLPLKISIEQNSMDSQKAFFPSVTALQDILKEEGYTQKFLLGSVGYFGGRELYMKDHGDVKVEDFSYWKRKNKFPKDYWVNWGFEDEKLYSYAREELSNLAKENKPFNLTLLTVDTHFPDGYVCRLCQNNYPDNQYANVYRCASRQVTDFVNWIKKQNFYENTTIVISGDHPTMDRDFCDHVPKSYQRKVYTVFLNSAAKRKDRNKREYSTFDYFPTTLAAMGVEIPGNRLGLGTNLFSGESTLTEKFGKEEKKELEERSDFMIKLGNIDKDSAFKQKEEKEQKKKKEKEEKENEKKEDEKEVKEKN